MIKSVNLINFAPKGVVSGKNNSFKKTENLTNSITFRGKNYAADKLAGAYRGYNNIKVAKTVSFTGAGSLSEAFDVFNKSIVTCKDKKKGRDGEKVGSRVNVSELMSEFNGGLPKYDDAIKTTINISEGDKKVNGEKIITDARCQIKNIGDKKLRFEMVVRPPRPEKDSPHRTPHISQNLQIELQPNAIGLDENEKRIVTGTPETAYVLNTKGKLMAIVEDGDNVLLTNAGKIKKKEDGLGSLGVNAREYQIMSANGEKMDYEALATGTPSFARINNYIPFEVQDIPVVEPKKGGSQGGGTELVIGLENGRFVPEIIDSIETFVEKVNKGEIVLDEFVPAENAQKTQIAMLAGGFGSRAEYTNASSSKIFHNKDGGSNLTKGCFRTATGLTPMETTFVSLHKAGLLDCSKGNLKIGKNIKFYLNDSGVNGGNGGFTVDMYNTMKRNNRENLLILPNDAMSRIPNALKEVNELMNTGKAAVVMVAKEVNKEYAKGTLGIMKINDKGEIEAFAEKPKKFKEGYVDENDNCFANTFQFAVSKEAFKALSILEPYLPSNNSGKEPRDWSKTFTPILMALTQNDDIEEIREQIKRIIDEDTPDDVIKAAKDSLKGQKIYAVKTSEPWADCGTLNALYHTTMQIASGEFPLEDFERKRVIDSVNTKTGLITSSPEQKKEIEEKYDVEGQVMVVPKAKPVSEEIIEKYKYATTKYSDVN